MAPLADRDRRHQRAVGADEGAGADHRLVLAEAVVVAGDGAGADIGARADFDIAQIGQVIGLGARRRGWHSWSRRNCRHARLGPDDAAGPQPRERADDRPRLDARAFDMAEGADLDAIRHLHPGPEDDMGADGDIAAEAGIEAEPDAGGSIKVAPSAIARSRRRPCSRASAAASSARLLMPISSSARRLDGGAERARAGGPARRYRSDNIRPWHCRCRPRPGAPRAARHRPP